MSFLLSPQKANGRTAVRRISQGRALGTAELQSLLGQERTVYAQRMGRSVAELQQANLRSELVTMVVLEGAKARMDEIGEQLARLSLDTSAWLPASKEALGAGLGDVFDLLWNMDAEPLEKPNANRINERLKACEENLGLVHAGVNLAGDAALPEAGLDAGLRAATAHMVIAGLCGQIVKSLETLSRRARLFELTSDEQMIVASALAEYRAGKAASNAASKAVSKAASGQEGPVLEQNGASESESACAGATSDPAGQEVAYTQLQEDSASASLLLSAVAGMAGSEEAGHLASGASAKADAVLPKASVARPLAKASLGDAGTPPLLPQSDSTASIASLSQSLDLPLREAAAGVVSVREEARALMTAAMAERGAHAGRSASADPLVLGSKETEPEDLPAGDAKPAVQADKVLAEAPAMDKPEAEGGVATPSGQALAKPGTAAIAAPKGDMAAGFSQGMVQVGMASTPDAQATATVPAATAVASPKETKRRAPKKGTRKR